MLSWNRCRIGAFGIKGSNTKMDLTGKLLIAMPGMGDLRFERSVILMCSHDDDGAMGLIINKPAEDVHLGALPLVEPRRDERPHGAEDPRRVDHKHLAEALGVVVLPMARSGA